MSLNRELLTGPSTPPVTLADVKTRAVVDFPDDDALLMILIGEAVDYVENRTGRSLMSQQWAVFLPTWPSVIELDFRPIASVDSIVYVDADAVSQTLATSVYETDLKSYPAKIRPKVNQVWPALPSVYNPVTVTITTGYASADKVPEALKGAISMLCGHLYQNRDGGAPMPQAVEYFVQSWRL